MIEAITAFALCWLASWAFDTDFYHVVASVALWKAFLDSKEDSK